jgi:predicted enzyme related to lactoylglutathione lyase
MSRPVHFEILADDPEKIAAFYEQVLGWQVTKWGGGPEDYWLFSTGPKDTPGIDGAAMHRSFKQAVINTVEVESLEDTLIKLKAAGGKVEHGPQDIPGVGKHIYCSDPEGIIFGVLQPEMPSE